ncbi:MAG: deoxyribonuclease IV [Anaerolineae bacterium]|nr:MAG: deoxyribonuclease IV [Anaerolineae bacterium]
MRLGAHESIAGGLVNAFERGHTATCDSIQIFTKSNRQWRAKPLSEEEIAAWHEQMAAEEESGGIFPVVAHTSYLINIGSPEEAMWQKSYDALKVELERCETLGIPYLALHPGSHLKAGEENGLANIARALSQLHAETSGFVTMVCLEGMAGQGTNLGYTFEQLAWLLEHTDEGERLGICLGSCHLYGAGYDVRTPEGYGETMEAFDRIIGLERLKFVHLNDSVHELGSRRDRHAHIGEGTIGLEGFRNFVNDPRLVDMPGLLETDKSDDLHEDIENLARLRSLIE